MSFNPMHPKPELMKGQIWGVSCLIKNLFHWRLLVQNAQEYIDLIIKPKEQEMFKHRLFIQTWGFHWRLSDPNKISLHYPYFSVQNRDEGCVWRSIHHAWPPFPPTKFWHCPYFSVQNRDAGCVWRSMHDPHFPHKISLHCPFFQYKIGTRDVRSNDDPPVKVSNSCPQLWTWADSYGDGFT